MPALILTLKWPSSIERIVLPDPTVPLPRNLETSESWKTPAVDVQYAAECVEDQRRGSALRFSLRYAEGCVARARWRDALETPLDPNNVRIQQGSTQVSLDLETLKVRAVWIDDAQQDQTHYARCVATMEFDASDLANLDYRTVLRLLRPGQARVRRDLIARGEGCAITRVSPTAVLDLAHILAAKHRGRASAANCMLLRSDLHRLFDAGLLDIESDGSVTLDADAKDLEKYREELRGARVDQSIHDRVRAALEARARADA